MQAPLSIKSIMANSIAKFVLNNPDITDVCEAYNQWVKTERYRDFPFGDSATTVFCLDIFDGCIHKISRSDLEEIYYNEMLMVRSSFI